VIPDTGLKSSARIPGRASCGLAGTAAPRVQDAEILVLRHEVTVLRHLVVGTVGVANVMVISVLERRSEIGLRRTLGAAKGNIRVQFLSEAIMLAPS